MKSAIQSIYKTKNFRISWLLVFSFIFVLVYNSCDNKNDGFSNEGVEEIAGMWTATRATFNGVDVVEEGGAVLLEIQKNGRFVFTIQRKGKQNLVFTGRLGFDEEWLAVEYDSNQGEIEYYDITYTSKSMFIGANYNKV